MPESLVREGSLSFSLAELSRLEDERLRRLRRAREEAEEQAIREKTALEEQKARATDAARQHEEEKSREALSRLRALESAEIARARAIAEGETRARLAQEAHRHAEALAGDSAVLDLHLWKRTAVASWIVSASVLVASILLQWLVFRPDARRVAAAGEAAVVSKSAELREARQGLEEKGRAIDDLRLRLDDQTRQVASLVRSLDAARLEIASPHPPRGPGRPPQIAPPPAHVVPFATDCPAGSRDPLCGLSR
jgi:hypothetical protein